MTINYTFQCPTCSGTGEIKIPHSSDVHKCGTCEGRGRGTRYNEEGILLNDYHHRDACYMLSLAAAQLSLEQLDSPAYWRKMNRLLQLAEKYGNGRAKALIRGE